MEDNNKSVTDSNDNHDQVSIPSPIVHKRNRTLSQSERIAVAEKGRGQITSFCRQKGHGFIRPDDGGDPLFVHVFDVEGEYVPHEGDTVEYRKVLIPPKNEKYQGVHVRIINFTAGHHETWDEPVMMKKPACTSPKQQH